jgi:hypothetical protein
LIVICFELRVVITVHCIVVAFGKIAPPCAEGFLCILVILSRSN